MSDSDNSMTDKMFSDMTKQLGGIKDEAERIFRQGMDMPEDAIKKALEEIINRLTQRQTELYALVLISELMPKGAHLLSASEQEGIAKSAVIMARVLCQEIDK